jgi:trehalose 6-phosphate synthase/phosphatase
MNLVAKEFIATKTEGKGVLIISEMTGAARELGEALTVNANNKRAIIQAIKEALEMPLLEQMERNKLMQERLRRYDISRWSSDFMNALFDIKKIQQELSVRKLSETIKKNLVSDYTKSRRRLLLLDYDGTLVSFKGKPAEAKPDDEIMSLLENLSSNAKNTVVIVSGRDRVTLERWLGNLNVELVAEHGGWIRQKNEGWNSLEPFTGEWKDTIRPILELYSDRTPGSSVEEKDFCLVWHYRRADPELAHLREQELRGTLLNLTENLDVGVFEGNKILEIRKVGINKGRATEFWIVQQNWDFLLAAGDDYTDEEMFSVLPYGAYSIKVGVNISKARFNVDTVNEVRTLLKELAGN